MAQSIFPTAIMCSLTLLAGCATNETYGDHSIPLAERAVIEGYSRYLFLFFEDLQIATVDGKHVGGRWADASSVSVPTGKHWLQFLILRNNTSIASCAFEWHFEAGHHYKLMRLTHDQALLAHPTSSRFPAEILINVSAPSTATHTQSIRAECGEGPHCLGSSDCPENSRCAMEAGFEFGTCKRDGR